ncbi:hypothetical protein CK09_14915, partial [Listeria monocytogenes]|uniref:YopX family protein n=1 Tax=Listeria monocytogenes TaxID=1639 RepID=UPI00062A6552|nr:YopX family protein [Listeria monocytogenes]AKG90034.1 hypothetical protein CY94_15740 [Listeria monocytogenes]EAC2455139.1 hypothetical protein [Listeria monocytogenes]EAC3436715.1 hypothetical protein [Listeria monocytogenes]EAC3505855.1 hypothetical protein [Listeria monocytogenes]EAC3512256.1 hypothetical protein [Listeria monocytogenes]
MRGIEFRGKIVGAEGFVYGKLLAPLASGNAYIAYDVNEVGSFVYISRSEKVDPETVGQYTGLKDKNGKKIFEGDIVDISVYDRLDWSSIKGKVVFLNGAWLVEDVGHFAITLQSETNEIEIIGNVHENLGLWEA